MNPYGVATVSTVALGVLGVASGWIRPRSRSDVKQSDSTVDDNHIPSSAAEKQKLPISDPLWQWSSFDKFEDQFGHVELKSRDGSSGPAVGDDGPFQVIYQRKIHTLWPDAAQVTLTSAPLIRILQQYLPHDGDLGSLAEPKLAGRDLCIVLSSLRSHNTHAPPGPDNYSKHVEDSAIDGTHSVKVKGENGDVGHACNGTHVFEGDASIQGGEGAERGTSYGPNTDEDEGSLHLKHLVRFLEKEYKDVPVRVERMRHERRVAWDMLWAFLPRGTTVGYYCDHSEELLCGVVAANYYHYNYMPQGWVFLLELDVWNFDGNRYKKCQIRRQITKFQGERPFAQMPASPIEVLGDPSSLENGFLTNGRRFYELGVKQSNRFMFYSGPMYQQRRNGDGGCWRLYKEKCDGRVMIDLTSFAEMNPDYPMENAQPPRSSRYWVSLGGGGDIEFTAEGENNFGRADEEVSDEILVFAPAIVYGFSFTLKKWGSFSVSGFSDINFDSGAFEELNMEPTIKRLIHNLVGQYIFSSDHNNHLGGATTERVDPISKKGEGCILLCHGPPGTGKTLTAESIAEKMRRPLWALSVSELGTTPNELEATLFKILDIAAGWKAVLLLDEADVYLEKRTSGADLLRNAMTGVFLRLLEYYRGVMFMTTNRIGTFDDAFRSRISLFVHYPQLSLEEKGKVWQTLLKRVKMEAVTREFSEKMAAQHLNGREIRNAIHTAQTWASSNGETFSAKHIEYVMGVLGNSLKALNAEIHSQKS